MDTHDLIELARKCQNSESKRARRLAEAVLQFFNEELDGLEEEIEDEEVAEDVTYTYEIDGAHILVDPAIIDGVTYTTGMNAFQSYKACYTKYGFDAYANKEKREAFAQMSLSEALQAGKSHIPFFEPQDWDARKKEIMKTVLENMAIAKIPQGLIVQQGIDSYFGDVLNGQNIVGKLLMEVRDEKEREESLKRTLLRLDSLERVGEKRDALQGQCTYDTHDGVATATKRQCVSVEERVAIVEEKHGKGVLDAA